MISPLHLQSLAEMFFAGAVVSIVLGGPIVLLAWTLVRLGGRQSSGTRFAVWYAALMAISLATFLGDMAGGPANSAGSSQSPPLFTLPGSWAVAGLTLWIAVATLGFLRLAFAISKVQKLRRSCRSINVAALDLLLQTTLEEAKCGRNVEVRVSDTLKVPTAIGFFRPLIILPSWTLQELSAAELRPILLHELAHMKRWDDWTNLLQKFVQAALCFHPAVWFIENRISLEREMACDDVVLAHTANPRAYAESLLSVAEKSLGRRGLSLAQAAVNRMRQTSARIVQILDKDQQRTGRIWQPATLLLSASVVLSFIALPRVPELVSFRGPVQVATEASLELPTKASGKVVPVSAINVHRATTLRPATMRVSTHHPANPTVLKAETPPAPNVIQARFNPSETESPSGTANPRSIRITRTTFLVTQPDPNSPQFVTVSVWQFTVFRCDRPVEAAFPAKKI